MSTEVLTPRSCRKFQIDGLEKIYIVDDKHAVFEFASAEKVNSFTNEFINKNEPFRKFCEFYTIKLNPLLFSLELLKSRKLKRDDLGDPALLKNLISEVFDDIAYYFNKPKIQEREYELIFIPPETLE